MSDDATVALIRSFVENLDEPGGEWEALAVVLEFGDGVRSASGYAYGADGAVVPVAFRWRSIEPAVLAYLSDHYEPGEPWPVGILVQFDRATGRYEVTFEETDEDRWRTRPSNFRQIREQLRPRFD